MNTNHTTQYEQCGTCASWTCHTDARMPDHGECVYRPVGHYTHRETACLFNPPRWSLKSTSVKAVT